MPDMSSTTNRPARTRFAMDYMSSGRSSTRLPETPTMRLVRLAGAANHAGCRIAIIRRIAADGAVFQDHHPSPAIGNAAAVFVGSVAADDAVFQDHRPSPAVVNAASKA